MQTSVSKHCLHPETITSSPVSCSVPLLAKALSSTHSTHSHYMLPALPPFLCRQTPWCTLTSGLFKRIDECIEGCTITHLQAQMRTLITAITHTHTHAHTHMHAPRREYAYNTHIIHTCTHTHPNIHHAVWERVCPWDASSWK